MGLVGAGLLTGLLLVEGTLRLFGLASPILYRLDPDFGYEPIPSQSSFRLGVRVHINDIGLRDDESHAQLMRSGRRVLVIGNSVTYGSSLVSQPELFTEVLERELRPTFPALKILNGGVAGYSTSQMMKRAPRLVELTAPEHLIVYLIREDFQRAPVRYPPPDSPQEPQRRPPVAMVTFLKLSIGFVGGRYGLDRHLPILQKLWPRQPHVIPSYDRSRVIDIHFEAVEEFLRGTWEASGRDRAQVTAFLSPTRDDVASNRRMPNADLVQRFEALGIKAYDLQRDFHEVMSAGDGELAEYYHDNIHYRPKGNEVAGRVIGKHLARELGSGP